MKFFAFFMLFALIFVAKYGMFISSHIYSFKKLSCSESVKEY